MPRYNLLYNLAMTKIITITLKTITCVYYKSYLLRLFGLYLKKVLFIIKTMSDDLLSK